MYALTVAPSGPKLQPVPDGTCAPRPFPRSPVSIASTATFANPTPIELRRFFRKHSARHTDELKASQLIANGADLTAISEHLASLIGRPVINKTGLKGNFSFRVTFARSDYTLRTLAAESVFTVPRKTTWASGSNQPQDHANSSISIRQKDHELQTNACTRLCGPPGNSRSGRPRPFRNLKQSQSSPVRRTATMSR